MFPTTATMPEDVVWKRDIYRQLDLTKDKNAPMYYPVEPMGRQVNLFTYLFRLILTGRINAYTYKLDGNESFDEKDKLAVKDMLERYGIYYEENNGKLTFVVDNSYILNSDSIQKAELQLTDQAGKTSTIKMVVYQPENDPNIFSCYAKTDLTEADIHGMKAEAFFTVEGFEHYSVATAEY